MNHNASAGTVIASLDGSRNRRFQFLRAAIRQLEIRRCHGSFPIRYKALPHGSSARVRYARLRHERNRNSPALLQVLSDSASSTPLRDPGQSHAHGPAGGRWINHNPQSFEPKNRRHLHYILSGWVYEVPDLSLNSSASSPSSACIGFAPGSSFLRRGT
jgi:hypothetical protein